MFAWVLCTYGIAFWLCFKLPIDKEKLPSFFKKLFACIFCTGFWSGMIASLLCFWSDFGSLDWTAQTVFSIIAYGFAVASVSYILDTALQRIEK